MYEFRLYVSGEGGKSRRLISDLQSFLEAKLGGQYSLQIIDVAEGPHKAHGDEVLATPTLVKVNSPRKKVIGDLREMEKVFECLGIRPTPSPSALP
jgi:circadian clock protein KaiB